MSSEDAAHASGHGGVETNTSETSLDDVVAKNERPRPRLPSFIQSLGLPEAVLFCVLLTWCSIFTYLPRLRHERVGTFGFDLGFYDQGVWLLSRFRDPFVTLRGLRLFGHHADPILLLLAPFYWLGAGPIFLLVVQVIAQAMGALALYLLARDLLHSKWAGVGIATAFCLNPTNQWLTWEFFHPDAVAIGPLLFAYWAARTKRWGFFIVAGALALLCKEDVALSLVVLGILIALRGDRRRGIVTAVISAAWFLFATRVWIPSQNHIGPFYEGLFGDLGKTPTEVVVNSVRHPTLSWRRASAGPAQSWYWKMLAPWALLPLLDLRTLVFAAPMIFVDVMSSFPYTRGYMFHYSAIVLVAVAVATVEAIAWISRRARLPSSTRNGLVNVVLVAALLSSIAWGPSPLSRQYHRGIWPLHADPRTPVKNAAISVLPSSASVSAAYDIVPHITHREKVYEFPVPWCNINWGVHGEHLDNPDNVQWLLLDRTLLGARDKSLLADLLSREFRIRFDVSDIVVAQRVHAPSTPTTDSPPDGGCHARPHP